MVGKLREGKGRETVRGGERGLQMTWVNSFRVLLVMVGVMGKVPLVDGLTCFMLGGSQSWLACGWFGGVCGSRVMVNKDQLCDYCSK